MDKLLFSCQGRIGRLTYFWSSSAIIFVHFLVAAALYRAGIKLEHLMTLKGLPAVALYVGFFGWINWALTTKRFHDFGGNGWMTAFVFFGPVIPVIGLYSLFLMGQLFFRAGDLGANLFGPPPGSLAAYSYDEGDSEARHAKAFAAIDAMARGESGGERPAPRLLPGAAPLLAPAPAALPSADFGRRNGGGFGRRQSAPV